ncbi:MAG: hypothetical protein B6D39_03775 [Anaerolineae bacterium UTCFX2]|jgi:predicted nucleotidyltransferase|nr:MAG: hypothetical protein B6D39_03775 [Anaerolineae bacterium UTCFX2]
MRITREFILKFANELVDRRQFSGRDLTAVYICGSFLEESYQLGDTGDVDLVMIHNEKPELERELVRLTDDLHLDISHQDQREYRDTRRLRVHPWTGPTLNACRIIHDPGHFLDFVQASVRGQFDRPDHIYARSRAQMDRARELWFELTGQESGDALVPLQKYLSAVEKAANSIASLSGMPLAERRLLFEFPQRAEALSLPGLYPGLLGLLGAPNLDAGALTVWIEHWKNAYWSAPSENRPVRLAAERLHYYLGGFRAALEGEQPAALLWPLLNTWTDLMQCYPDEAPERANWRSAVEKLELYGKAQKQRLQALDAYLDLIEEALEDWAHRNGAWESA